MQRAIENVSLGFTFSQVTSLLWENALYRITSVLVVFVILVFLTVTTTSVSCQAQTFNFFDETLETNVGTLELFDLTADNPSEFGRFSSPESDLPFPRLFRVTFDSLNGELGLINGELQAVGGDAILSSGDTLDDIEIRFSEGSSLAEFEVGTFGTSGTFTLAVPEPSSTMLILLSVVTCGIVRSRKLAV